MSEELRRNKKKFYVNSDSIKIFIWGVRPSNKNRYNIRALSFDLNLPKAIIVTRKITASVRAMTLNPAAALDTQVTNALEHAIEH